MNGPTRKPDDGVPERARRLRDFELVGAIPFVAIHLATFGILWTGVTPEAAILCGVLYVVRMLAVTAGYHRYFAHRTFTTSRPVQLLLAVLAQTSAQKGVLWWAAHHRKHHVYADTEADPHSPIVRGFWYSHLGWIFDRTSETDYSVVSDFRQYPELRWLNRHHLVPPAALAVGVFLLFGWSGLIVGFALSTVLVWHATFAINSIAHLVGRRRFETRDDSRNSMVLALITFGEGWHNNHHFFAGSTRQGFRWWEIDVTYYVLRLAALLGLVWDLRRPPAHLLDDRAASEGPEVARRSSSRGATPVSRAARPPSAHRGSTST